MNPQNSEITPRHLVGGRRGVLRRLLSGSGALALGSLPSLGAAQVLAPTPKPGKLAPLPAKSSAVPGAVAMDKLTTYKDASGYNNFYELGTIQINPK